MSFSRHHCRLNTFLKLTLTLTNTDEQSCLSFFLQVSFDASRLGEGAATSKSHCNEKLACRLSKGVVVLFYFVSLGRQAGSHNMEWGMSYCLMATARTVKRMGGGGGGVVSFWTSSTIQFYQQHQGLDMKQGCVTGNSRCS